MAVRTNGAAFAQRLGRLASSIPAAQQAGVVAAAKAAQASVVASARARGWKPTQRWVTTEIRPGVGATVTLRGARAYWAERGTKAHDIRPRTRKAVRTPQGPRARVDHPGARPRPFWRAGVAASRTTVPKAFRAAAATTLARRTL